MEFKSYESFFDRVGDSYIEPVKWGECLWPVSVEEMYQHFKARMLAEIVGVGIFPAGAPHKDQKP